MPDITTIGTTSTELSPERSKSTTETSSSPIQGAHEELLELHLLETIKFEFYEKGGDFVTVRLNVQQIEPDSVNITFGTQSLEVAFKTSDVRFLKLHNIDSVPAAVRWKTKLEGPIFPELCSWKQANRLEINLKRMPGMKWSTVTPLVKVATIPSPPTAPFGQTSGKGKSMFGPGSSGSRAQDEYGISVKSYPPKPLCRVEPYNDRGMVITPGYTGLRNIGNTCFLNSVLQVLFNTVELKHYFLNDFYVDEVNELNPLGMKGLLAKTFANLMTQIWNGMNKTYEPSHLKNVVATKAHQFANFAQHDSQEFLSFLLDGLHEDLNRVKKKPLTTNVESDGRPDDVVANEAWDTVKKRDDSIIVDLFYGQYKSKLHCPSCQRVSITFDPFLYLAAPFPRSMKYVTLYFFNTSASAKPVKYTLPLRDDSTIRNICEALEAKTRVKAHLICIGDIFQRKVWNMHKHTESISVIQSTDTTFAFARLDPVEAGEEIKDFWVLQSLLVSSKARLHVCESCQSTGTQMHACVKCYQVAYCSPECETRDYGKHKSPCSRSEPELVGHPFLLSVPKSMATYSRIEEMIEQRSRYTVDLFQYPMESLKTQQQVLDDDNANDVTTNKLGEADDSTSDLATDPADAEAEPDEPMDTQPSPSTDESIPGTSRTDIGQAGHSASTSSGFNSTTSILDNAKEVPVQPTRLVIGEPRHGPAQCPLFFMSRCNKHGKFSGDGNRKEFSPVYAELPDKIEKPLDLSGVEGICISWRNKMQCKDYLSIQHKQMNNACPKDLSLDYEDAKNEKSNYSRRDASSLHLNDLLELFTKEEILSIHEAWYCDKCKKHQQASKKLSLWRLPPLLVVQLKRFQYSNFSMRNKIEKPVDYPIKGFDVQPFMSETAPADVCTLYDLYGVVCHMGSLYFGHYISYARCPNELDSTKSDVEWRQFDDSHVSKVGAAESQVVNSNAYLLFYKRRDSTAADILQMCEKLHRERNFPSGQMAEPMHTESPASSSSVEGDESGDGGYVTPPLPPSNNPAGPSSPVLFSDTSDQETPRQQEVAADGETSLEEVNSTFADSNNEIEMETSRGATYT